MLPSPHLSKHSNHISQARSALFFYAPRSAKGENLTKVFFSIRSNSPMLNQLLLYILTRNTAVFFHRSDRFFSFAFVSGWLKFSLECTILSCLYYSTKKSTLQLADCKKFRMIFCIKRRNSERALQRVLTQARICDKMNMLWC